MKYARAWAGKGVGKAIRETRQANGVTVIELARTLDVSRSIIYRWEAGQSCPALPHLMRLAWALGVPPSSLLDHCD